MKFELQRLIESQPKHIRKDDELDPYGARMYWILSDSQDVGYYSKQERDTDFQTIKTTHHEIKEIIN
jgi:hypothetical protein